MLDKLLPLLCDPIDKVNLKRIKNKLVGTNEYKIKNDIPIMMVDYSEYKWSTVWDFLQECEYKDYQISSEGIFSDDTRVVAKILSGFLPKIISGKCLDVGSGCLAKPAYMNNEIDWYGIDPYFGDKKKEYPFVQGISEKLPFKNKVFDGVFFGTSLEHCLDPIKAIKESLRVLRKGGKLAIWFSVRAEKQYEIWKDMGGMFDTHHRWAWSVEDLNDLIIECGFKNIKYTPLKDKSNKCLIVGEA